VEGAYDSSVSDGRQFTAAEPRLKHQHHCSAASAADDEGLHLLCRVSFTSLRWWHLLGFWLPHPGHDVHAFDVYK